MSTTIQHDAARHRFETVVDGVTGYVDYSLKDGALSIDHTIVPAEIGGRGIAGALVKAALEHARAEGMQVIAACTYADAYITKHPEYEDLRKHA